MGFEILELLFRGICVGVAASITVGPVAVLCIQRTLSKSRKSGIVSGIGVACADTFMAMAALFFYSMLQTQIEQYNTLLRVIGGIFVVIVGVYIFAQNPVPQIRRNRAGKTSLGQDFASIFGLTIANFIMVIPYILAFFAVFKISSGDMTQTGFGGFVRSVFVIAGFFGAPPSGGPSWHASSASSAAGSAPATCSRSTTRPASSSACWAYTAYYPPSSPYSPMSDIKPNKIIIAVDGFSSCGKSTFAKAIAARLGYIFIDTGAMYRAVTLYALEHGAIRSGIVDEEAVVRLLGQISITFRFNPQRGASDIYVNGDLAEGKIRTIEVSNCVSRVSAIPEVRQKLVAMQQEMGRRRGVVMDGRDIGTVVFPDAELKIFMTADPAVRARRRYDELKAKGDAVSLEEIERNVRERDKADMSRAISPLRQAPDAVVLDNSHMTVEEQMAWFMERFEGLKN